MLRNICQKNTIPDATNTIIIQLASKNGIKKRGKVGSNSTGTSHRWIKSIVITGMS